MLINFTITALFIAQIFTSWNIKHIKPKYIVTPYPPSLLEIKAKSFGDIQFVYRYLTFELQNAGDKFNHISNINSHDYKRLIRWFDALGQLDKKSVYVPFMAAYYYSFVKDPQKSKIIAEYITNYASHDIDKHWRLLTTAIMIYDKQVGNSQNEILKIGNMLTTSLNVPAWAKYLPAFVVQKNDICASYNFLQQVSKQDLLNVQNTKDDFFINILKQNVETLERARHETHKCL